MTLGFPGGSDGKESSHNMGDLGSITGLGRSPGEGNGYPLQYSGLENLSPSLCKELGTTESLSLSLLLFFFSLRVLGQSKEVSHSAVLVVISTKVVNSIIVS